MMTLVYKVDRLFQLASCDTFVIFIKQSNTLDFFHKIALVTLCVFLLNVINIYSLSIMLCDLNLTTGYLLTHKRTIREQKQIFSYAM